MLDAAKVYHRGDGVPGCWSLGRQVAPGRGENTPLWTRVGKQTSRAFFPRRGEKVREARMTGSWRALRARHSPAIFLGVRRRS